MKDGGPAFPCYIPGHTDKHGVGGLSLRDYFAAQALTGVLAMCADPDASKPTNEDAAGMAYDYADAMLAQRGKGKAAPNPDDITWQHGGQPPEPPDRNPVTHVNAGHGGEAPQ